MLLSVPHSGRDYPAWLLESASGGKAALQTLEDPLVDRLIWRALTRGCGAIIARAPRAAIDCNRAEDEIDPSIIEGTKGARVTARARGGLGIIPGRTLQHGCLWRKPITRAELGERINQAHRPYHRLIEHQLAQLVARFGCALLLDCHSMPPPPAGIPPIVFGDCLGRTADGWLSREAISITSRCGFEAGLNDPFAGGHIIERHARPAAGVHALQLEIDRRSYLDEALTKPGCEFDRVASLIENVAVGLGEILLGQQFATAAE